jgi:hypothetical protein
MLAVAGLLRQLEQRASQEPDRAASAAPTVRRQGGASRAAAGAAPARVSPPRAEEEPAINWEIGASAAFAFARRILVPPRRVRWADWWPCAAYMVWDEPDPYVTGAAGAGTTTTTYLQCVRVARRQPPSSFARCRPRPRSPRHARGDRRCGGVVTCHVRQELDSDQARYVCTCNCSACGDGGATDAEPTCRYGREIVAGMTSVRQRRAAAAAASAGAAGEDTTQVV